MNNKQAAPAIEELQNSGGNDRHALLSTTSSVETNATSHSSVHSACGLKIADDGFSSSSDDDEDDGEDGNDCKDNLYSDIRRAHKKVDGVDCGATSEDEDEDEASGDENTPLRVSAPLTRPQRFSVPPAVVDCDVSKLESKPAIALKPSAYKGF